MLHPLPKVIEGNLYNHYLATHFKEALEENKIHLLSIDLDREKFSRGQDSLIKVVSLNISEILIIAKKR